jgi:hypothetical protein
MPSDDQTRVVFRLRRRPGVIEIEHREIQRTLPEAVAQRGFQRIRALQNLRPGEKLELGAVKVLLIFQLKSSAKRK